MKAASSFEWTSCSGLAWSSTAVSHVSDATDVVYSLPAVLSSCRTMHIHIHIHIQIHMHIHRTHLYLYAPLCTSLYTYATEKRETLYNTQCPLGMSLMVILQLRHLGPHFNASFGQRGAFPGGRKVPGDGLCLCCYCCFL